VFIKLLSRKLKISYTLFFAFIACFLLSCSQTDRMPNDRLFQFIEANNLNSYDFIFIVHFSPHDCMGCLFPLGELKKMRRRIDANSSNTFVAVTGDSSLGYLDVYNSFDIKVPILNFDDLSKLKFFRKELTPTCYFVNLKTGHLIYFDKLPEEEITFNALRDLVYAYSGIMVKEDN
jgi:hypothetical protein